MASILGRARRRLRRTSTGARAPSDASQLAPPRDVGAPSEFRPSYGLEHRSGVTDTSARLDTGGADDAELDALRGELVRELDRLARPKRGG